MGCGDELIRREHVRVYMCNMIGRTNTMVVDPTILCLIGVCSYAYTVQLEQLDARRPATPVCLPPQLGEISTPLHWEEWDRSLCFHPDQPFRAYVVNGIRHGFRVGFGGPHRCRKAAGNMASARSKPEVIREYLAAECSNGRVLGPLDPTHFPQIHTSRFGVIPKGQTGKW